MFKFLKNKELELTSPVIGEMMSLNEVPDKVFASKMMGEGVAFQLSHDTVCAPCDGVISLIPNTLHAFGIKSDNDAEILVHIGLDTVNLNGEGFQKCVEVGSKVKRGTPIIKVDLDALKSKGIQLITPMVVTNSSEFNVEIKENKEVTLDSTVLIIKCK